MKEKQDYVRDLAEIRSMMERSSKFLSLSGWAGVMAGIYALAGAFVAYKVLSFQPGAIPNGNVNENSSPGLLNLFLLALAVLLLAVGTAIFLSHNKAKKRGEKIWNATSRRLLANMAVPLAAGGLLALLFFAKNLTGFVAPLTLIFYGLALFNAGRFTYEELRVLGLIQIGLGLIGAWLVEYGLLCWAIGFGVFHIVYGIYIHFKYER